MRWVALVYGTVCYLLTGVVLVYTAGFLSDAVVPRSINSAARLDEKWAAAADCALIALFGLQHSGMARPAFKRVWTQFVPPAVERSTYVLLSNAALIVLLWLWQPLPRVIWDLTNTPAEWPIWFVAGLGGIIVLAASFQLDHWQFMGLRQVRDFAVRRESPESPFETPGLYRFIRHPLMAGLLLVLWATPFMTVSRLLFNAGLTGYSLLALRWEERDLLARFGPAYADYRRRVPLLIPWRRRRV